MDPNPQSALPLPPRPSRERYHKLAKELVRACSSTQPQAVEDWAKRWLRSLSLLPSPGLVGASDLADFARRVVRSEPPGQRAGLLSKAQFVVARTHGFDSWPKFVRHLEALSGGPSFEARFEAGAEAIIRGDLQSLRRLLTEDPTLVRARSSRQHGAALLHYVAANGVETYRQKTPANIVEVTELLLDAGAEVDATAAVYGGHLTTLELAATSQPPESAGVQEALLSTLLGRGASLDRASSRSRRTLVDACLANGRRRAAEFLSHRGARLDLSAAAGLGRLEVVRSLLDAESAAPRSEDLARAVFFAAGYGHPEVLSLLLDRGFDLATQDGAGQTAVHHAVIGGQLTTLGLLLSRNPPLELRNVYGGTVVGQALWSAAHGLDASTSIAALDLLIRAGAQLPARHVPVGPEVDAWLAAHGCPADPSGWWVGEEPES